MTTVDTPAPMWVGLLSLDEPALTVIVEGLPAPQGSKSYKGMATSKKTGKPVPRLVESSKGVKPWRESVAAAAEAAAGPGWVPLDGPLIASMVFSMPTPKRHPKRRVLPAVAPDLSKLLRATEDALDTDAGVIRNDSRIVTYARLAKVYAGDPLEPDALHVPGVVIRLWPYPSEWLNTQHEGVVR